MSEETQTPAPAEAPEQTSQEAAEATGTVQNTETAETRTEDAQPAAETKAETPAPPADDGDVDPYSEPKAAEAAVDGGGEYLRKSGLDSLEDVDLGADAFGDRQTLPASVLKGLAPALEKAGVDPAKAKEVVGAFAAMEGARLRLQAEQDQALVREVGKAAQAAFGDKLHQVARDAEKGAVHTFGAEFWEYLKSEPILVRDPRFMRGMAKIGEALRDDNGGPSGSRAPAPGETFTAESWVRESARMNR